MSASAEPPASAVSARSAATAVSAGTAVAVTTGARVNPLAALLIWRLREAGHRPALLLSTAPPAGLARLAKARRLGWAALQRRWQGRGGGSDPAAAAPIDAYAAERGYPSPWQSLAAVAAQAGLATVRAGDLNVAAAVDAVAEAGIEVVVNAGGGLFRPALIEVVPGGILNAHMGDLPRFRGMNALEWSLLSGAPPTVTLHYVAAGIDTGDIIARAPIPVRVGDTLSCLRARYVPVAVELVAAQLAALSMGQATSRPQRPGEGRQYFAMHPRLRRMAEARLRSGANS